MEQISFKPKFNERLADLTDPIISAETENWRELAVIAGLSAAELEESLKMMPEKDQPELRMYLDEYQDEIRHIVERRLGELYEYSEELAKEEWHQKVVCPKVKEKVTMSNLKDLREKDPTGNLETQSGEIQSKNDVIRFKTEARRHHHELSWGRYLKRLKAGKKPTINDCRQALKEVPLDSQQEVELKQYLGRAYLKSGQFANAETTYHQALALCEKLNWTEGKSPIYSDLGYTCAVQGWLNDAEEWLLKAQEIDKQFGKSAKMAINYGRLAVVYRKQKEFDKAEKMARKSLRLAEQHGLEEEMSRQYNNLGMIYLHQYKLDEAERMIRKGLDVNKRLERSEGIANNYFNLGLVYRAHQNIRKTGEYWQNAKDLYKKLGMQDMVDVTDRLLADIKE